MRTMNSKAYRPYKRDACAKEEENFRMPPNPHSSQGRRIKEHKS